jgi:hypothetical protein
MDPEPLDTDKARSRALAFKETPMKTSTWPVSNCDEHRVRSYEAGLLAEAATGLVVDYDARAECERSGICRSSFTLNSSLVGGPRGHEAPTFK